MSVAQDDHSSKLGGIGMRHLLVPGEDRQRESRVRRLSELGIGYEPVPEFDALAREVGELLGAYFAGVNLIDGERYYFAGLYVSDAPVDAESQAADPDAGRVMPNDMGYCRHVIERRRALVLEDIQEFARFAVDQVRDETGIRSYLGTPLIDHTGVALGTVWAGHMQPRRWGRDGLEVVKSAAARLMAQIERAESARRGGLHR